MAAGERKGNYRPPNIPGRPPPILAIIFCSRRTQCARKIHCTVFDAEDFQPGPGQPVEDQVVFKMVHPPRSDSLQVRTAKSPQPSFEWVNRQPFNGCVNCLKEAVCSIRVVLAEYWK